MLLVADETALPALTRLLPMSRLTLPGTPSLRLASTEDILALEVPGNIALTWLVRSEAEHGRRVVEEVRRFLGLAAVDPTVLPIEVASEIDVEVWETPRYSSSGEDVEAQHQRPALSSDLSTLYAWIAGGSWLVKALRRSLVMELNVDRAQVAFMGYWREGVSMKS